MAENVKMECDLVFEDEQGRSFNARVFRTIFEAFIPKGSDPGTIFLRDLRRISPVNLFYLLPDLIDRLIILDLRSTSQLDDYPFAICDALETADLDWEALLHSVPPHNVVILYGSNDESVAHMRIASLPEGLDVRILRGGLQEWCETGLPVNPLRDHQVGWSRGKLGKQNEAAVTSVSELALRSNRNGCKAFRSGNRD